MAAYHEEQKKRRDALKIKTQAEYEERNAELAMLYSTPYGDMSKEYDNQRFEDIRDLQIVTSNWEDKLKAELQRKLDNPTTGMYANQIGWTDVDPFEIVEVRTANKLMVRLMSSELDPSWKPEVVIGGFSGHTLNNHSQKWIITSNEKYKVFAIRKRKDGRWYDKYNNRYQISEEPSKFHDFNF